jgi:hypothetical protein
MLHRFSRGPSKEKSVRTQMAHRFSAQHLGLNHQRPWPPDFFLETFHSAAGGPYEIVPTLVTEIYRCNTRAQKRDRRGCGAQTKSFHQCTTWSLPGQYRGRKPPQRKTSS